MIPPFMKKILLLILLIYSLAANAQNYQCLQSNVKHYFTNPLGYMRGVRVDSVTVNGSDSVFHEFHTGRPLPYFTGYSYYDTASACWLGKDVIMQPDGTFYFNTHLQDTVVIKSQAAIGASWVFYNDTSAAWYEATVTAVDTMSFIGLTDSVKTITITAYWGSTPNPSDSLNNLQIILSKNHGFVKVLNLYTFPFYPISTSANDFYDAASLDPGDGTGYLNIGVNLEFSLVNFKEPTFLEIYNFNIGDAFCYHDEQMPGPYGGGHSTVIDRYDTVIGKEYIDSFHVKYTMFELGTITYVYFVIGGPPLEVSNNFYYTDTLIADSSIAIHVEKMPEEYRYASFVHYRLNDTTRGITSAYFERFYFPSPQYTGGEGCGDDSVYKVGFPILYRLLGGNVLEPCDDNFFTQMAYSQHSGATHLTSCRHVLSVPEVSSFALTIVPNPAYNEITVHPGEFGVYSLTITDMLGRAMFTQNNLLGDKAVDVTNLPNGMYLVGVTDEHGNRKEDKVVVKH